jgi:hypothetical protein
MRGGEYIIKLSNIDEKERGYLFGLFLGDGYSFHNPKDRHYHVEFYLNSITNKGIIHFLCQILRKVGLNPILRKDKRFKCMRIRVNSKNFYNFINQDYKKFLGDNKFSIGFVSGFLDAEGYVNKKTASIVIVNTNLGIIKNISSILDGYNIENKVSLRKKSIKDKQKIYNLYVSVKFKSLNHLSVKAGSHRL